MVDIEKYIKLSKEERQQHLRLDEPCLLRGSKVINSSGYLRGLLAHIHDTTMPNGHKIHVCHACNNNFCSNPNHLYWGTASENNEDKKKKYPKTCWEYTVEKYGIEKARELQRRKSDPQKAGRGNKGKPKSTECKNKISLSIREVWRKRKAG